MAAAKMAAPCPLLGDGVTDDTLLHIASFLGTAKDLLRLQLTNKRFAAKVIAAPSVSSGGGICSRVNLAESSKQGAFTRVLSSILRQKWKRKVKRGLRREIPRVILLPRFRRK